MSDAKIRLGDHIVLVDLEDLPMLSRYNWYVKADKKGFYACADVYLNAKRSKLYMHRLLMGMQKHEVDHVNRNGLDNRKQNLRYCVTGRNAWNRARPNITGYKGVGQYKRSKRFHARIQCNGVREEIGYFKSAEEAARAYDRRAKELFGNFALLNFGNTK